MPARRNPLRAGLPGYVWDERMRGGRWRTLRPDGRPGRLVSNETLLNRLGELHDASAGRFADMAEAVINNEITAADFQAAIQMELRSLYGATAALGRGGFGRMGPVEWGRNGQALRFQYERLAGFAQDLADGKLALPEARARAAMYAKSAWSRFWQEDLLWKVESGEYREYQWIDARDERECDDCEELAARGWVPIGELGTVPGAGDTQCLTNCRCGLRYR